MGTTRRTRALLRLFGLAGVAGTAALAACAPIETSSTDDDNAGGRIVFARAGGEYGDETIFIAGTDGSDEAALIEPGSGCCASVSPDGSTVLFLENSAWPLMSSTIPVRGGEITRLASPDETMSFVAQAWSPDGARIALEGWDDADASRNGAYSSTYPDGTGLVRISTARDGAHDIPADYSPDGTELVIYRASIDGEWDQGGTLAIAQADGSGVRDLPTPGVTPSWWVRWSPDGERLLFATGRMQGAGALWTIRPDGSDLTALYRAPEGMYPITPVWSPDGTHILFALNPEENEWAHPVNEVHLIPASGGEPERQFGGDGFQRRFDWITG
ncbi:MULTISPECIES: PD40 domain-containing protein [Microbacterium]|uniref:TolB family protein n=1 Tax=Microbacterium TaxID=33882 RepID=UPI000D654337|nr:MULTISPECIES: PD40 domain-containing protein [Microbacterium]